MRYFVSFFLIIALSTNLIHAKEATKLPGPPVNTYSIVAYDSATGQFGGAVQSHWFHVSDVLWIEAGVGAIATQSIADFSYGSLGLEMMKAGKTSQQTLDGIIASDPNSNVRQVGMVDIHGNVATHTGSHCIAEAGHRQGVHFTVQANLMLNNTVWDAMYDAYLNSDGDMAEKLLAALDAAQAEGGDIRGMQSAAIVVVTGEPTGLPWKDRIIDVRVDDSQEPLKELRRLVDINRAYNLMDEGDNMLAEGKLDEAGKSYSAAAKLAPGNVEVMFWHAVTLVEAGELDMALPIFKKVFAADKNWKIVIPRIAKSGFITSDEEIQEKILAQ